jgi:hypothetical protein
MESLKQSCLRWVVFYLVLFGITSTLIYVRFPRIQLALGAGAVSAAFLWMGIAYLIGIRTRKAEARMIRQGITGGRPEDGEKIAVVGTVRASTDVLEAPFTRRRCVAYEYKILPPENESAGAWDGFAMAPWSIEGSRGIIRVMAAPELSFKDQPIGSREHYDNALAYLAATTFDVRTNIDIGREMRHLKEIMADDDGRIRYDIQRRPDKSIAKMILQEKILAPGDKVIAIGRYSATRGGLVPDKTAVLHPVKILKDDPEEFARKQGRGDFGHALLGCGCLLPVIIAAFVALAVVPLDAIEQMLPQKDPSWTEVRLEQWVRKTAPGLPFMPENATVSIALPAGEARGKLTADGNTIALLKASAERDGEVVAVTLSGDEAPAAVVRIMPNGALGSIRIGRETVRDADIELRDVQVAEDRILGRITALSADRKGPHLRAAFHASVASSADDQ